jgi:mannobiose 2-epimerase
MEMYTLQEFKNSVRDELKYNILPFWLKYSVDKTYGGFVGQISNDLKLDLESPKGLILNTRILWTFSAIYRFSGKTGILEIAERAFKYLNSYFWDIDFGGYFWLLDSQGKSLDDKKKIYGQAFSIYAHSEYYLATGITDAKEKAIETFNLIEKNSYDSQAGGYFETCNRNWSIAEDLRLSEKDLNEQKSMNNHLHLLEAYTNLYRIWKDSQLARRLRELLDLFQTKIINLQNSHFNHFFNEKWETRSANYTFGHDIEGSWLLCEAANVLNNTTLKGQISQLALQIAEACYREGRDWDGGLFYEGKDRKIVDANKEWWPQAEATVGFLNAYQISRQKIYLEATMRCWQFIQKYMVDHKNGEWYWRVSKEGIPDLSEPKVSQWKGPYHNGRACLEILSRLKSIKRKEKNETNKGI